VNASSAASTLQRLQEYLKADPGNWNLRAELFDTALAAGAADLARVQLDLALRDRPDDAAWRHREATLLLATRQYAQAQAALEALIAAGHDAPAIRYNLGFALFSQGRLDAASETLAPLLALPDDTGGIAWVLWLRCMHRLYRQQQALAAFAAEAERRAMPPDAWGVAALMAFDDERVGDARAWSERALQGRPDQLEGLVTRGSLALAVPDAAGAIRAFEAGLALNPSDGRTWSGLALARMLKIDLPGALQAFQKAVSTMPNHVGTWLAYGWCQLMTKDPRAARASFEEAMRLDRNVAETHGGLAVALARLGEEARAREEIEIALRLDPKNLSVRYAQTLLSGEAGDAEAFTRVARRVLSKIPAGQPGTERTLADVVFKDRS
jgi:tetratricopeptide (TPR) repeat protein